MKRRESLKVLLASSGALLSLPSWAENWTVAQVATHTTTFSANQQVLLSAVADTIIPAGNSIGAIAVGVDKFLLKLIDDCHTPEMQQKIKTGVDSLDKKAQSQFKKSFATCDQKEREQILLSIASEGNEGKEVFELLKSETIRGFSTSRQVMVDYHKYKTVPGHYYGCVDINS
jgi:hypothetical protein